MEDQYAVVVTAGTMTSSDRPGLHLPHAWTPGGVAVETEFTGAHLFHLATAACVLNDLYREARALGLTLDGVRVRAAGGFDTGSWASTGIGYEVELDSPASAEDLAALVDHVDEVAEIPRAVRAGAPVGRRR